MRQVEKSTPIVIAQTLVSARCESPLEYFTGSFYHSGNPYPLDNWAQPRSVRRTDLARCIY